MNEVLKLVFSFVYSFWGFFAFSLPLNPLAARHTLSTFPFVSLIYFFTSLSPFFLPHSLSLDCVNAFALVVHPPTEQENLLFSFRLTGEETVKTTWLRTLCRHVANTICKADAVRRMLTHTHTHCKSHGPKKDF